MGGIEATQVFEALAILGAGFLAGAINVIVGAGTLVSFPILVFLGVPPVSAAISNALGLVPGNIAGMVAYRAELRRHARVVRTLVPASAAGAVGGATLLLVLPPDVFGAVVPWLIGLGSALVVLGPAIKRLASRGAPAAPADAGPFPSRAARVISVVGAVALGCYGGYFSAAQGVLLIALLGITTTIALQDLNGLKNASVAAVNVVAAVVFLVVSPELIAWPVVGLLAIGAALGGLAGGRVARLLPAWLFRGFVVVIGVAAILALTLGD